MAVDRLNDALQDRGEGPLPERPEEVSNREIVGHAELSHVGDHDLYVPAAVLMCPRREGGPSALGQLWRDLDTDHPAERPPSGLVHNSTFSTSEVHEGVAVRDSDMTERPG